MGDKWELVRSDTDETATCRMKVPGGWLYRESSSCCDDDGNAVAVALCFVPSQAVAMEKAQMALDEKEQKFRERIVKMEADAAARKAPNG